MGWTALEDNKQYHLGYVGDDVWDAMGDFVDKINEIYMEAWGRRPNRAEREYILDELRVRFMKRKP